MSVGDTTANLIGYLGKATQYGREIWAPGESNGAIPVNIQDQHTLTVDTPISQQVGGNMTLAVNAMIDTYTCTMSPGHTFITGDQILLTCSPGDRAYYGVVLGVAGDVLTLDTPLNYSYPTHCTTVVEFVDAMNVNGAVTRQTFAFGTSADVELDVTRLLFEITTTDPPEFTDFGDIATGLTRGVVCRIVKDGLIDNLWNIKKNSDLALLIDGHVYEQPKVFGVNGIATKLLYAGPDNHGVTLRLAQNEFIEIIIQDDLTSLLSFKMHCCGHVVTD